MLSWKSSCLRPLNISLKGLTNRVSTISPSFLNFHFSQKQCCRHIPGFTDTGHILCQRRKNTDCFNSDAISPRFSWFGRNVLFDVTISEKYSRVQLKTGSGGGSSTASPLCVPRSKFTVGLLLSRNRREVS
jgi:hypothetical protein